MPNYLPALLYATVITLAGPAFAQADNSKWKELNQQITERTKQHQLAEATALAKQALELAFKNGPDHPDVAASEARLGDLYVAQSQDKEAELHYQRALKDGAPRSGV